MPSKKKEVCTSINKELWEKSRVPFRTIAMGMKPTTDSAQLWKAQVEQEQSITRAWNREYDTEHQQDAAARAALERTIQREKQRRKDYCNPEKNPELYTILYRQDLENAKARFQHHQKSQEEESPTKAKVGFEESGPSAEPKKQEAATRGPASSAFASAPTFETTSRAAVAHLPPVHRTHPYLEARCNKYTTHERFPLREPPTSSMGVGWYGKDSMLAKSNMDLYKPVRPNVMGPYRNADDGDHALLFGYDLEPK